MEDVQKQHTITYLAFKTNIVKQWSILMRNWQQFEWEQIMRIDPSKGTFASFTNILCNDSRTFHASAVAIDWMHYNKDMAHGYELFVAGKKLKNTDQIGIFHLLSVKFSGFLVSCL